jgi:hypothetical protein
MLLTILRTFETLAAVVIVFPFFERLSVVLQKLNGSLPS